MSDEKEPEKDAKAPRNWSRKTLTREVLKFCREQQLTKAHSIAHLVDALKTAVMAEDGIDGDLD